MEKDDRGHLEKASQGSLTRVGEHLVLANKTHRSTFTTLALVAVCLFAFGAIATLQFHLHGKMLKEILMCLTFCIVFPVGLLYMGSLSLSKRPVSKQLIETASPCEVTIKSMDTVIGSVLLTTPDGDVYYSVDDPAFGLLNAIRVDLRPFKKSQDAYRHRFNGKPAILYSSPDNSDAGLVIDDSLFLKLKSQQPTRLQIEGK